MLLDNVSNRENLFIKDGTPCTAWSNSLISLAAVTAVSWIYKTQWERNTSSWSNLKDNSKSYQKLGLNITALATIAADNDKLVLRKSERQETRSSQAIRKVSQAFWEEKTSRVNICDNWQTFLPSEWILIILVISLLFIQLHHQVTLSICPILLVYVQMPQN